MGSGVGKARRVKFNVAAEPVARPVVDSGGTESWRDGDGQLHRVGGPAVKHANGAEEWCEHGRLHRVGGPAVVYGNGDASWYQGNKLHRDDGPAVEYADGRRMWYLRGELVSELVVRKHASLKQLREMELELPERITF